jgi:hypothetical protein
MSRFRGSQKLPTRFDANFGSRDTGKSMMLVRFMDLKFLGKVAAKLLELQNPPH